MPNEFRALGQRRGVKTKKFQKLNEKDIIIICDVGAYGSSLGSNYNLRSKPAEILINKSRVKLIRKKESINKLIEIGFDGYAIGGLAVGESQSEMFEILSETINFFPKNKPRYLMGVGTPSDI